MLQRDLERISLTHDQDRNAGSVAKAENTPMHSADIGRELEEKVAVINKARGNTSVEGKV